MRVMRIKSNLKAGGISLNHNEITAEDEPEPETEFIKDLRVVDDEQIKGG